MQPIITENREKIAELCRQHHVRTLSVFGSAVRDDFDPTSSDVDMIVDFEPLPYPASIDNYWSLEDALRALFVRKVDLIRDGLIRNPYFLREIRSEQVTVYAA